MERKKYNISVRDKDYSPENNTQFTLKEINKSDLRDLVKKNNYSLIEWKNGDRREENFKSASGIIVDVDDGLTIKKAIARLKKHKLNYFIVTSKSHTKEDNKYHMLMFFSHTVYNLHAYKEIGDKLLELFPEADPSFRDGARFIFGSPKDSETYEELNGTNYDVSEVNGLWDRNTELLDKYDKVIVVDDTLEKTPIKCPFHNDSNPSAFVQKKDSNFFIYCSSCNKTFWMYENREEWLKRLTDIFYAMETNLYSFTITDEVFSFKKINKTDMFIMTGVNKSEDKDLVYEYIIKNKYIFNLNRVDHLGDIGIDHSYYTDNISRGLFKVHYKAIQPNIQDNQLIEDYLQDRFGEYKDFIKQWLAAYCYTNYKKLPTLIFSGDRGGGKSSFAEIIAEIFPSLSFKWNGLDGTFNYEREKKFLIVEENEGNKLSQYKTLKDYAGSKKLPVNKKFKDPYNTENNINTCLLSNEVIPVFVRSEELPANSKNNQFFVYEFPKISGEIDTEIQPKIIERLGHYIRTELKTVFDGLDPVGYRYYIDVPITEKEKALFENNTTESQQEVEEFISEIQDMYTALPFGYSQYFNFVKNGQLPVKLIKEFKQYNYHSLVKALIKKKYISGSSGKSQVDGQRLHCYKMTDKLIEILPKEDESVL